MRLQRIHISLTFIIGSLLLTGMLLVNFVLIILWQRDALQHEIDRDQVILARVLDRLPAGISILQDLTQDFFSFSELGGIGSKQENGRILLYTGEKDPAVTELSDIYLTKLMPAISETMQTGEPAVRYSGSFLGLFSLRKQILVNALPIIRQGRIVGGVGIARSLTSIFQELWRAEKIVLVYIVINFLVFTVIGFFRMRKMVVLPIEGLVRLADQYHDQQDFLFVVGGSEGEFGQLANSLNSMLTRIEQDRKSLEKTVEELGAANLQLKTQQREMIRTEKLASVGRMAAGLAHEIGNPLGVVQGYLGLLARSGVQNEEHRDFIRRADQELQRVNALIRQMLDFARVSKGEPEKFSLHKLLYSVVEMVQVQPVCADIGLICRLNADRDTVFADQDQLRQVFVNGLLNSADAVKAAGREDESLVTVSTDIPESQSEDEQTEFIRIRISDNGIGIAREQLSLIFDPFYTTKEPGKGTGLGLSVSLSIVESLGGRIEMESEEGQGCVLSIFLPVSSMTKSE